MAEEFDKCLSILIHTIAVIDDPYPAYRYLQDNDPVHYSHALRSWILTRYQDVRPSLNDPRLSADQITPYLERISPD